MNSSKTTIAGVIAGVGAVLTNVPGPSWLSLIGQILSGLGTVGIGLFARDHTVSDVQAGATGK